MKNNHGLERVLGSKKDLIRLFLIAAILAFSVSGLASIFVSIVPLPTWSIVLICALLLFLSVLFLVKDLLSTLEFTDSAEGVLFIDTETNSVFPVKDYKFSEEIFQTFNAIKAESKAIYSEWEKHPLVKKREKADVAVPSDQVSEKKESWISIVKVTVDREKEPLPQSVRFLKEAAQFVLLEELSLHLSTYFNDYEEDKYIKEYCRNDIPAFLLNNRVLNLLSTPIEDRDIFIKAYPNDKGRPEGEIVTLWGSGGAVYSRFDLVLPKDTIIQQSDTGSIKIETKRLMLELEVDYSGSSAVVSLPFINHYIRKSSSHIHSMR